MSFFSNLRFLTVVLLLLPMLAAAQSVRVPVRILNGGEVYSTYFKSGDNAEEISELKKQLGSSLANDVLTYSLEDNWPVGINSLDGFMSRVDKMYHYKAYRIARFKGTYAVIVIPASENGDIEADMRPARDIYFVINESALSENLNALSKREKIEEDAPAVSQSESSSGSADEIGTHYTPIVNTGDLFSTFTFDRNTKEYKELATLLQKQENVDYMEEYSNEKNWPEGIKTLSGRNANRPKMNDYRAFYFGKVDATRCVLYIPAMYNQHMDEDMRPTQDFFFVISETGIGKIHSVPVEPGDIAAPEDAEVSETLVQAENETQFGRQLDQVVIAYAGNFSSIKGDAIPEEEGALKLGDQFVCKVSLEGAEEVYLTENMLSDNLTFVASFREYSTYDAAKTEFYKLVKQVDEANFSIASMVKLDENVIEDEGGISQAYLPFAAPEAYEEVVLELRLIKGLDFDGTQLINKWYTVINVYRFDD